MGDVSKTDVFDASVVRAWALASLAGLGEARSEIDALNVFPVPDGDTGTNLFLTMESATAAVEEAMPISASAAEPIPSTSKLLQSFARGALLGARGNSGVITSQLLRGIAEVFAANEGIGPVTPLILVEALERASVLAYGAVGKPKEGTVLTVSRLAAQAGRDELEANPDAGMTEVVKATVRGAQIALDDTPNQLPVLKEAGVVDSGGRGLVVILDSLLEAITGEHKMRPEFRRNPANMPMETHTANYGGPAYEVMFLLDGDDDRIPRMRERLGDLGDSLVVVGGDRLWNVHVHVDDVGAAIEVGIEAGRPYRIKVTHLEDAESVRRSGHGQLEGSSSRSGRALVAVAHGPGIQELLSADGVTVVEAVPGRRPSTAELLDGVRRSGAQEVVLLPSDGDTRTVAEAAAEQAREEGIRAAVIPTRSVVQTLAAVAVHQPGAHFDDDLVGMGRASATTRYGAVTIAVRDAVTTAGVCRIGDVLGLVDGDIVEIGQTLAGAAARILDRMLASGGELVTVVTGADADQHLIDAVVAAAEKGHPDVEVDVIEGRQPLWPLILGVE